MQKKKGTCMECLELLCAHMTMDHGLFVTASANGKCHVFVCINNEYLEHVIS